LYKKSLTVYKELLLFISCTMFCGKLELTNVSSHGPNHARTVAQIQYAA